VAKLVTHIDVPPRRKSIVGNGGTLSKTEGESPAAIDSSDRYLLRSVAGTCPSHLVLQTQVSERLREGAAFVHHHPRSGELHARVWRPGLLLGRAAGKYEEGENPRSS